MRTLLALVVLVTLTACASRMVPATASFQVSKREQLFASAAKELKARGFRLDTLDVARGVLQTDWEERPDRVKCGYVTCAYQERVEFKVSGSGAVELYLDRELALWGSGYFTPTNLEQRAVIEAEERAILDAILAGAGEALPR